METTDNTIEVSTTVIENAFIGMAIKIGSEDCGRITDVNDIDETITVETKPTTQLAVGSFVKVTVTPMREIILGGIDYIKDVGKDKIGSSFIPAGTTLGLYMKM